MGTEIRFSLCLLAAALAGCGSESLPGGGSPPNAGALVADSIDALERTGDPGARFRLTVEAKPRLRGPAALLLGERLSLEVEGAAAAGRLVASGRVEGAGQSLEGELRVGDGLYLRVGDEWYGTPGAQGGFGELTIGPRPGAAAELAAALREAGDDVLDGEVGRGRKIGGDATWELRGTLNPDAVVSISRRIGTPLSAREEAELRAGAKEVRIEYAAGRADHLPRRIAISGELSGTSLPRGPAGEVGLEGLKLELELEISGWGTEVKVEPPARYTSFQELLGSVLTGSGFSISPGAARPGPPPNLGRPQIPPATEIPPAGATTPPPEMEAPGGVPAPEIVPVPAEIPPL